jgi:hypothetical protein
LPGRKDFPPLSKAPYYDALEAADAAWKSDKLVLNELEDLLSSALAKQLADYHRTATGQT